MSFAVMISHSTKERPIAEAICERLEAAGFPCWMAPRNIPAGAEWTSAILEGIAASRMMVLVFSGSANESRHVAREVLYAGDNHKPVLPFRVQDTNPTGGIAYYLLGVQWLDAWPLPLEPHFDALVSRVQRLLGEDGSATAASPATEPTVTKKAPLLKDTDIPFQCPACGERMVIEEAGAGLEVDCLGCGRPVTVPGRAPLAARASAPTPPAVSPADTDAIVERLGSILGPIARHLVKTKSAQASSLPDLYQKLAEFIPGKKDREAFLATGRSTPAASAPPATSPPPPTENVRQHSPVAWPPGTLDALKHGLSVHLGPMAGLVVEQTAKKAGTLHELHDLLAAKISSPKDREKWKKSLPGSPA